MVSLILPLKFLDDSQEQECTTKTTHPIPKRISHRTLPIPPYTSCSRPDDVAVSRDIANTSMAYDPLSAACHNGYTVSARSNCRGAYRQDHKAHFHRHSSTTIPIAYARHSVQARSRTRLKARQNSFARLCVSNSPKRSPVGDTTTHRSLAPSNIDKYCAFGGRLGILVGSIVHSIPGAQERRIPMNRGCHGPSPSMTS